jgi:hypothetical protein
MQGYAIAFAVQDNRAETVRANWMPRLKDLTTVVSQRFQSKLASSREL